MRVQAHLKTLRIGERILVISCPELSTLLRHGKQPNFSTIPDHKSIPHHNQARTAGEPVKVTPDSKR